MTVDPPSPSRKISAAELQLNDGRSGRIWMALHGGVVYDLTEFLNVHPGGEVMRLGAGRDATILFESYHPGGAALERVHAALKRHGTVVGVLEGAEPSGDDTFFRTVRDRVEAHLKASGVTSRHGSELVGLGEAVVTVALYFLTWWWRVSRDSLLAAILCGVLLARLGFLMHSGNHAATSRSPLYNRWIGALMDVAGSSARIWGTEHQIAHHMYPNVHGRDNNCEIGDPLMRLHPALKRFSWQRWQHVYTFIGMSFGLVKWIMGDFAHFAKGRVGHTAFHVSPADWARLLSFKTAWALMHIVLPAYWWGLGRALWLTLVVLVGGGHYMENIFIVNHIQAGLVPAADSHWAVKQVIATANWCSGKMWANIMSGGLNHQIEHHLFPSMSVHLYPLISPVVRQTCAEFKLPYHDFPSFSSAWIAMATYLKELGRTDDGAKAKRW